MCKKSKKEKRPVISEVVNACIGVTEQQRIVSVKSFKVRSGLADKEFEFIEVSAPNTEVKELWTEALVRFKEVPRGVTFVPVPTEEGEAEEERPTFIKVGKNQAMPLSPQLNRFENFKGSQLVKLVSYSLTVEVAVRLPRTNLK